MSLKQVFVLIFCCFILMLDAVEGERDYIIVPGERVGAITAKSSLADLINIYGKENVGDTLVYMGEGEYLPGTAIYPDDSLAAAMIVWEDDSLRTTPYQVDFRGSKTKWKTREGISLGTTLKELETYNGCPFILKGFEWDYQGTVMNCNQGKIVSLNRGEPVTDDPNEGTMIVRLAPDDEHYKLLQDDEKGIAEISGDQDIKSDNKYMQLLEPRIYEIIIFLNK